MCDQTRLFIKLINFCYDAPSNNVKWMQFSRSGKPVAALNAAALVIPTDRVVKLRLL